MPHGPVRPALLASAGAGSFALALGALVAPRTGALAAEGESETRLPGRQMLAQAGKNLPELATGDAAGDEAEEAPREDGADIAFAWFAVSPVPDAVPAGGATLAAAPFAPAVESKAEGVPRSVAETLHDFVAPASPPQGEEGADIAAPISSVPPGERAVEEGVAELPTLPVAGSLERADARAIATLDAPDPALPKAAAPDRRVPQAANPMQPVPGASAASPAAPPVPEFQALRTNEAPAPQPEEAAPPAPARRATPRTPAVAVLPMTPPGPQIHPAILATGPATPAPLRRALAVEQAALGVLPARPDAVQPHIVSTPADVQQNMLDTRRQEWAGKMIEHIEALRDAAPVRETRLSLAPEALGKVDVSIRHDGDRVHVHFTTETAAARQLIADAQPRLSELAEARGLKLGQTSFESGAMGQGANRDSRNNPTSQPPLAPRRAHSDSAVGSADDERIA